MTGDGSFEIDFSDFDGEVTHEMIEAELAQWRAEQDALRLAEDAVIAEARGQLDRLPPAVPPVTDPSNADWLWDEHRDNLPDPIHDKKVADAVEGMRVRQEAIRIFSGMNTSQKPFDAGTLAEIVSRGPEPAQRITGLMPFESNLMLIASKKTGKTTCVLNVARSLITGENLFGKLEVRPIAKEAMVAILNYEVAAKTLARWATEIGVPAERLFLVNLRGRQNPLKTEDGRARLGALLKARRVEVLIVDVFTKAFTGDDQSNNSQTQVFFDELEQWAREDVEATELIVTAHAGKIGDSFRGASQPEGWADVNVYLTRDSDKPTARRYLAAEGRDVAMDKTPLNFDVATRLLNLGSTTSAASADAATLDKIEGLLRAAAVPMNSSQIEDALSNGHKRDAVRDALKFGLSSMRLTLTSGKRNAKLWTVAK